MRCSTRPLAGVEGAALVSALLFFGTPAMTFRNGNDANSGNVRRPPLPMSEGDWNAVAEQLALSPRQTRIVELVVCGLKDRQIADELGISVPTVRTYLSRIFSRLHVDDRVALIVRVFSLAHERNGEVRNGLDE